MAARGGHDSEFVCEVPGRLICHICAKALREPHLAVCCGQHFCESCLKRWFEKHHKESCPHCRAEGEEFSHVINKGLRSEINQLEVKCNNHDKGCKWTGELGALKTHLESDGGCGFVVVRCPNRCYSDNRITISVQRKDLDRHLTTECSLRQYKCEYCGHEDTYRKMMNIHDITDENQYRQISIRIKQFFGFKTPQHSHYDICPEFPLSCPNECGTENIKRKNMDSHRSECPQERVQCPNKCYSDDQTRTSLQRRDLKKHLETECYLRQYQCEHCGYKDNYYNITGRGNPLTYIPVSRDVRQKKTKHYDECPELPLTCPNSCGAGSIKRKNLYSHRSECPQEPVPCPFAEAGCKEALRRCQLEGHVTSSIQQHLLLVMNDHKILKERLRETEGTLKATQTKLKETETKLKQTETKLEQLTLTTTKRSKHSFQ